jgi:curli production assembly/transport component CsgG
VTVNLRAVDIATGEVLANVTTSKTIYSHEIRAGVYRFVSFRRLLEAEGGYTHNEPVQMAVMSAIESAVVHLVSQGIDRNLWTLQNPDDMQNAILEEYRNAVSPMM